jgi:Thiolase, C-terminal domain
MTRSNRLSPVTAHFTIMMTVFVRTVRWRALPSSSQCFRTALGRGHGGQQFADHRWCLLVILASEHALAEHKLQPKAVIVDSEWSALDPSVMGLSPVLCSTAILKRYQLRLGDIDLWELNEAFAAQVLGCLAAWEDPEFCRSALGLDRPAGSIPRDKSTSMAERSVSAILSAPAVTALFCIWSMQ